MATKRRAVDTNTEVAEATIEVVESNDVVFERDYEVRLFGYVTVDFVDDATKLVVENIGGGEVYVTNEVIGYNNKEVIKVGDKMEFDTQIVLTADTIVRVKVTQLR